MYEFRFKIIHFLILTCFSKIKLRKNSSLRYKTEMMNDTELEECFMII